MERILSGQFLSALAGSVEIWLAVAYLVCMFTVAAFRPQQIADEGSFRRSYILFACYFVIPAIANAIVFLTMLDAGSSGKLATGTTIVWQLSAVTGQVLLAASIVFALASLKGPKSVEQSSSDGR